MILRSMRNGFFSALFLGLLVLGGFSLVLTDWTGTIKEGINKTDVAKVAGTPIKISEFNNRVNRILHSQQIDPAMAYQMGLIDNILRGEVYDLLIKKNAEELGIRVADRIIAEHIKELISPLKKDGMTDKDALKQFLEMQGMTEKQLVSALRDELVSKILKSTLSSASYAPQSLVKDSLAYRNEARSVDYAFFANANFAIKNAPTDSDLEKYYQGIAANYMIPEHRDVTLAIFDASQIAAPAISDEEVKAAYESQKDTYMQPEQAEVEQALFSDKDAAQKVADAVKSGKDLKDSVLQITGKDSAFQGKNSFAKDGLPSAISGPVFAGKSGDLIGPVLSPLGYHVIKLIGLKAPQAIAFDKVKDKIRKELEDEKSGDALYSKTTEIEDRLANGEQFEDIKDAYHLTLIPLKNIDKNSKLSKELSFAGKSADQVMAKILSVSEGPASELKDIGDNKLFSVHLDKLVSAAPQPFANVKADVQRRWTADNQSQENMLNAQKLVDDLNAGKTNVSAMEDAMKVKLQNIPALTRTEKNSPLASDVAERFMRADKGQFIMAISKEKNGVYIGRVQTITLPEQPSAKTENSRAQIESDLASSNYMNYLGTLQNKYSVTINDKLLERTYGQSPSDSK